MTLRAPFSVSVALLALTATACTGEIGGAAPDASKGSGSGSGTSAQDCTKAPDPGTVVMRRLTHAEYDNTIRDLIGDDSAPSADFPSAGNGSTGFDNEGAVLGMSPLLFEKYANAAKSLVDALMASDRRGTVVACDLGTEGQPCAEASLATFAGRAFRRPVSDPEKQRLAALVQGAIAEGESAEAGFRLALRAILLSPKFLYRIEFDSDPASATPHPVTDHELASRLSYFLWGSMPDGALLSAADAGGLNAADAIASQVTRMLADPKAQGFIENFAGQWLGLRSFSGLTRDATKYPNFDDSLKASMRSETELFFGSFLTEPKPVQELLTAGYTYADTTLAAFYGLTGAPSSGFGKVAFSNAPRLGLMTQASVITTSSKVNGTSPPKRGKWVLGQLLCDEPAPPPPNVPPLMQEAVPTGSIRQKFEEHEKNEGCKSCHSVMDPVGFAFENYDAIGAYRTIDDNGFPVDASGTLPGGANFSNAVELASVIAADPEFPACLTARLFVYAAGRADTEADTCALASALSAAEAQGTTLPGLITALAQSVPFTQRRGEP